MYHLIPLIDASVMDKPNPGGQAEPRAEYRWLDADDTSPISTNVSLVNRGDISVWGG